MMTTINTADATTLAMLATEIMAEHTAAIGASRLALDHARRAGELLLQAKAQLRHGEWLPWLAANCDLTVRNAQVYMQIAGGWSRLEEHRNAYPNTHLDITSARHLLGDSDDAPAEDEGDDDEAADETDMDGCAGNDNDSDTDDGRDEQIKTIHLYFPVATWPQFREQLAAVTEQLDIDTDNDTDRIRAVVACMHDLLFRKAEAA
jgi:Protein of unknown function (DUF3102)